MLVKGINRKQSNRNIPTVIYGTFAIFIFLEFSGQQVYFELNWSNLPRLHPAVRECSGARDAIRSFPVASFVTKTRSRSSTVRCDR